MGKPPAPASAKLREPVDRSEINRLEGLHDPSIASEKDSDILTLIWFKDTDKKLVELGKSIERQIWFGKKGQDPDHLVGVWLDNKTPFPEEFKRLESMFKYTKLDGNVSKATSMRRVADFPTAALSQFEYKGYLANGGGLNGKPTGLFHAFKARESRDFLILQDFDLKVTEGGIGMTRERVNARVRGRPAIITYIEQTSGAVFLLYWAYDGFYRQAHLYCADTAKCDYKEFLLRIANEWN